MDMDVRYPQGTEARSSKLMCLKNARKDTAFYIKHSAYKDQISDKLRKFLPILLAAGTAVGYRNLAPRFRKVAEHCSNILVYGFVYTVQWCSRYSKSHFARNLLANRQTCY